MREYSEMAKFNAEVRKLERERIDDYVKDKLLDLSIKSTKELKETSRLAQKTYYVNLVVLTSSIITLIVSIVTLLVAVC